MIREKLFALPEFQRSRTILFYASFGGEVETFEMIKQAQKLGKKIALPTVIKHQKKIVPVLVEDLETGLTVGSFGIKEPKDTLLPLELKKIDMVIVPGVAFDKHHHRLGRGAGYYDRFLCQFPTETSIVGLAYDFQLVDRLPPQIHDIPMTHIIAN